MARTKAKPLCTLGEAMYTLERHRDEFFDLLMLENAVQIAALRPGATMNDVVNVVIQHIDNYRKAMKPQEKNNG